MAVGIIVCGAAGRMGRTLINLVTQSSDLMLVGAVEAAGLASVGRDAGESAGLGTLHVPIVDSLEKVIRPDAVTLDFTNAAAAVAHLRTAVKHAAPIVIGSTGYTQPEQAEIDRLAPQTRAVVAPNMSVGINVLLQLVRLAARTLGPDFDPEIVEIHHKTKIDAPSGTALQLGRAVASALGRDFEKSAVFGRQGIIGQRNPNEIGMITLRGGDAIGDHTVVFAGLGERLELTHRAQSRDCLARGALRAATWLIDQPVGRYSMADVLGL
ncbi:MAG: 4-hydroxy-tetrahydrodipicolinate reductase [Deltaproteobacteria bacterium]|nr:4-hydroxy-tetrahydrodipicolinate reductase [Deltaproteobacteria bacterium]MBI3387735.1 4-hydroxy-tetrahydrodipicolinate reductase [Deltaproteobacteria bacterium]